MKLGLEIWNRILRNEAGEADGGGGVAAGEAGGSALGGGVAPAGTGTVTPAAAAAPTVSIPENWKEAISQEFRDDPSLKPITNLEGLVKSYIHSQKMIGRGKMSIPDQHATDADWKMVYRQLGLPEKIEDYSFDIPEDAQFDDGFVTKLKEVAYQQGILPRQMKGFIDWYSKANNEAIQFHENQAKVERETALKNLKQEWGQAFDQRLNMAKAAIRAANVGDHVYDWLNQTGLGDDPTMIKLLSAVGQMLKEDNLVGDFGDTVSGPKELQSRIEELRGSDAYTNRAHPNHQKVINEMQSLFQQLYPKKQDSAGLLT